MSAKQHTKPWNQKYLLDDATRAIMIRDYDGKRGTASRLAKQFNIPRTTVNDWARRLNITTRKFRRWTLKDDQFLESVYFRMDIADIAKALERTPHSIRNRAAILGFTKATEGYTLQGLRQALGCSERRVRNWIDRGWLRACKRSAVNTSRNNLWYISDGAIADFVAAHPEEIKKLHLDDLSLLWLRDVTHGRYGIGALVPPAP